MSGTVVLREKWPVLGRDEQAATWLQIWTDLGRAPRTIDAYARGLAECLLLCEREDVDPVTANRAHVAVFVRELTSRPAVRDPRHSGPDDCQAMALTDRAWLSDIRSLPLCLYHDIILEWSRRIRMRRSSQNASSNKKADAPLKVIVNG